MGEGPPLARPVVCMISDGTLAGEATGDALVARVRAAAAAGVDLIQIRERELTAAALLTLVERCMDAVRGTRTRVLVNDRLDVALAAGAHGVHLRADSMARVSGLAPAGFLVGRSVHDPAGARTAAAAGNVDYLVFGTVFASASKPGRAPAGIQALTKVVRATVLPVLAVGGVGPDRFSAIAATGAAGWAAIGLFSSSPADGLQVTLRKAALAFDTPDVVP